MRTVLLAVVMVGLLSPPAQAQSGQGKGARGVSPEHVASDERLLPNYPLVAKVVIRDITDANAKTNGNPPRLKVEILDLVSGTVKAKMLAAVWRPFPHDVDYGVPETNPRVLKWKEMANPPPALKSIWLLAGQVRDGVFEIAPRCRYPFTEEKLAWVKKTVVEGKQKQKEAEEKAARELKDRINADQAVQKKADLKKLWDAASDVIIGKRSTEGIGPTYYNVTFAIDKRLKDARADKDPKQTSLEASVSKAATPMVHNRLYLYRDEQLTYVAFIKAVPGENSQSYLSSVDKRCFEFVDKDNGLVILNDGVLEQLKELARPKKAEKPARLDQYGDPLPAGAVQRLGTARLRHGGGGVRHVAFDPDSVLLASTGDDDLVRLWDAVTGQQVQAFEPHTSRIDSLAYAPDGKTLATGSHGTVHLWDVRSGKEIRTLQVTEKDPKLTQYMIHVVFAKDGKTLLAGSADGFVRLWDPASGKLLKAWRASKEWLRDVALSPDGKLAASCDWPGVVRIWDLTTTREVQKLPSTHSRVVFSPNSKLIATSETGQNSCVYEIATGKQLESSYHRPEFLAFSAENKLEFAVNDKGVWHRPKDSAWTFHGDVFEEHKLRWVNAAVVSPDGKLLASAGTYGRVGIYDLVNKKARGNRPGHAEPLTAVAFSNGGKYVVSAGDDGTIRQWDAATGKELRTLFGPASGIFDLAVSRDGQRIVFAARDKTTRVLDAATGKELRKFSRPDTWPHQVDFASDGRTVVVNNLAELWHWDIETGKEVHRCVVSRDGVECIGHSPDGKLIAFPSLTREGAPRLRDLATGKEWPCVQAKGFNDFADVRSMLFSPDGKLLVLGSRSGIVVIELATKKEVWSAQWVGGPSSLAFSRDGKLLAAGAWEKVRLWDTSTGKALATFRGDRHDTRALAFSPDSKLLAAASDDTSVLLWQTGR